jgi:hypothetical protein
MSDIATVLLACASRHQYAFSNLHLGYLINSGPFGYKFKVDDTPDVKKGDQHCFDLGL